MMISRLAGTLGNQWSYNLRTRKAGLIIYRWENKEPMTSNDPLVTA